MSGEDIQIENGNYTRIHNEILEVLAKSSLTGQELRALMFLFRKTYGWQKTEDAISLSQWAEGMGLKHRHHALSILEGLIAKKIITREKKLGQIWIYGFNKYTEEWGGVTPQGNSDEVLPPRVTEVLPPGVTEVLPPRVTTKETKRKLKKPRQEKTLDGEAQAMFWKLAQVCHVDMKLKRGQLNKVEKQLREAGYSPGDLDTFSRWWYEKDFRGKRGDPPSPQNVVDKILQAKQETRPKAAPNGSVKIVIPDYMQHGGES